MCVYEMVSRSPWALDLPRRISFVVHELNKRQFYNKKGLIKNRLKRGQIWMVICLKKSIKLIFPIKANFVRITRTTRSSPCQGRSRAQRPLKPLRSVTPSAATLYLVPAAAPASKADRRGPQKGYNRQRWVATSHQKPPRAEQTDGAVTADAKRGLWSSWGFPNSAVSITPFAGETDRASEKKQLKKRINTRFYLSVRFASFYFRIWERKRAGTRKEGEMASENVSPAKESAASEAEVVSVELPAPEGWKKKVRFHYLLPLILL